MNAVVSRRIGSTRRRHNEIRWRHNDAHITTGDGVHLAVRDYDRPTRTHTVVFLHGLCLSRTSWERQIDYLLRRYGESIRIIAYDHRGHGGSSAAPMSTYRIDRSRLTSTRCLPPLMSPRH